MSGVQKKKIKGFFPPAAGVKNVLAFFTPLFFALKAAHS